MAMNSKSYKEYHRRLLFVEAERPQFFNELANAVSLGEEGKVRILLEIVQKEGHTKALATYKGANGESLIHLATMFNQSSDILKTLIKICPELMTAARKESMEYYGQTALHVAIAKGNIEAVEDMLSEILNLSVNFKAALLHTLATGTKFANTVMMGELALSVAALTFNLDIIDILLQNGAELDRKNTKGDTVFHSLIKFAAIYPEYTASVLTTMEFLQQKIKEKLDMSFLSMECDHSDLSYIWFIPNGEDLNPLQLSASLAQPVIFQFILQLPKVYSFLNSHDGLFDCKSYDITEIDTVATERWASDQKRRRERLQRHVAPTKAEGVSQKTFSSGVEVNCCNNIRLKREKRKSILETMFDIKAPAAFEFIQQPTVRHVIKTKWLYYRWFYYLWGIFHILFMVTLTAFAVYKADDYQPKAEENVSMTTSSPYQETLRVGFIDAFSYVFLVIGALFLFMQVIHTIFQVKSFNLYQLTNVLHNGLYRVVLAMFSLSLILEFILSRAVNSYENYTLIIALISGWWFSVFFLRAWKKFSFFTVMIQKIIFGDLLRFSIIIVLMLIAFTAAVYMTFKGSQTTDDNLLSYGHTMMLLFKLMLGLGDIEALYEARRPWMAVTLFIVFVILTYVLMFNALIAMMSQTCAFVSDNRLVQWRVQQLSVIMFFEGVLCGCLTKLVGEEKIVKRFDANLKQVVEEKRFFLDMHSLQTKYANAEDIFSIRHRLQTIHFGDQHSNQYHPSLNYTSRTIDYIHSPRYNSHFQADNFNNYSNRKRLSVSITPATDLDQTDLQSSPKLKHRKSKREKSPKSAHSQAHEAEGHSDSNQDSGKNTRQNKRKPRRKRVEPEGDINASYDNQSTEKFCVNQEQLKVPTSMGHYPADSPLPERRRYYSEGGLVDTHIGSPLQKQTLPLMQQLGAPSMPHLAALPMQPPTGPPMQQKFPIRRVQPTSENVGSLDIGVIADSYM